MQNMQTSKAKSVEVAQRKPRPARQLKSPGSDSISASSSPLPPSKMPKERNSKIVVQRSVQSSALEKKRPIRISTMETQITKLEDELKKAKDQLSSSESGKRRAKEDAEEALKQLKAMSSELEESRQQLLEFSTSEDERIRELRKISQERDRAWQSELEALQKQHSLDSAALASAMNEIQKLKLQLRVTDSEANHCRLAEIQSLRIELKETLSLVEELKSKLSDYEDFEARSLDDLTKMQTELGTANATIEVLRSEAAKAMKALNSISMELKQSKENVSSLEALVSKHQNELAEVSIENNAKSDEESEYTNQLKAELNCVRSEVGQLRIALDAADRRYQDEYLRSTLQIRTSYEQVESITSEARRKEAAFEAKLDEANAEIEQVRTNLMDKEGQLLRIAEENKISNLNRKSEEEEGKSELVELLKKLEADVEELKASLLDKETELQGIIEENEMLRMNIRKTETESERKITNSETTDLEKLAKSANPESLNKLSSVTDEANLSKRRGILTTEQTETVQNSEMKAELRRLKVQLDQWRKAAEAAAAMLSPGKDGKLVDIRDPIDSNYPLGSLYSDDIDDDSPKKKNINMLKKIGVLWKKGQK